MFSEHGMCSPEAYWDFYFNPTGVFLIEEQDYVRDSNPTSIRNICTKTDILNVSWVEYHSEALVPVLNFRNNRNNVDYTYHIDFSTIFSWYFITFGSQLCVTRLVEHTILVYRHFSSRIYRLSPVSSREFSLIGILKKVIKVFGLLLVGRTQHIGLSAIFVWIFIEFR